MVPPSESSTWSGFPRRRDDARSIALSLDRLESGSQAHGETIYSKGPSLKTGGSSGAASCNCGPRHALPHEVSCWTPLAATIPIWSLRPGFPHPA